MSPEQMRGDLVDVRSDLYALGATCYEALTGRTPHGGQSIDEISAATLYEPITAIRTLREDCPEVLERILLKALSRERDCRYETPTEMRKELERWVVSWRRESLTRPAEVEAPLDFASQVATAESALPATAMALAAPPVTHTRRRRRPTRAVAVATAACLAGLFGLFAFTQAPLQADAEKDGTAQQPNDDQTGIFQSAQKLFTAPGPSRSQRLLQRFCPRFLCPGETNAALSTALDS
jgi:hypothetical protein